MCERFRVSGRVQGVFFRASAQTEARRLGLTGYVRNLPQGEVEALACGSRERIAAFCAWLHHGPPAARVQAVLQEPAPEAGRWDDFVIRD